MPAAPDDVVLTGVGVFSPVGIGPAAFWENLAAGRSGVDRVAQFVEGRMPVSFGSEVRGFDPREHVRPRKSIKVMSREIQLGFAAADQAFTDAGLAPGTLPPERLGVVFGADMIYDDFADLEGSYRRCRVDGRFMFDRWAESAATELYPLWLLKQLPNMVASHVAIHLDARGPNNTIVIGETSSLQALAEAASVIRRGRADVMVVGGTGCRLHLGALLFRGDSILSHRNEDCARASRPFDLHRDGMVNGEGAAAVVIESADHARRRGATIRGRLVAAAARCERRPGRGAAPAGHALHAALAAVLDQAGLRPADVSHVNAHGLSTVAEDRCEAGAIAALLGDVPVTAPKSFFGHLGAGGALVELLASLLGAERGLVPPTINYETPDPACPLRVVHGAPAPCRPGPIVKLSAARTGQAAAAVVAPPGEG